MKVAVVVRVDGGFLVFSDEVEVAEIDVAEGRVVADDAYDAAKWSAVLKMLPEKKPEGVE